MPISNHSRATHGRRFEDELIDRAYVTQPRRQNVNKLHSLSFVECARCERANSDRPGNEMERVGDAMFWRATTLRHVTADLVTNHKNASSREADTRTLIHFSNAPRRRAALSVVVVCQAKPDRITIIRAMSWFYYPTTAAAASTDVYGRRVIIPYIHTRVSGLVCAWLLTNHAAGVASRRLIRHCKLQ